MSMLPSLTRVLLAMEEGQAIKGTDAGSICLGGMVLTGSLTTPTQNPSRPLPLLLERLQYMGLAVGPMEGILMAAKADGAKRVHVRKSRFVKICCLFQDYFSHKMFCSDREVWNLLRGTKL